MISNAWQAKRLLVPRWRSLTATLASQELAAPARSQVAGHAVSRAPGLDYLARVERWKLAPSLVSAAELVEAAIIEGREREAVPAARRLLQVDMSAAPLIREQAAALLIRTGHSDELPNGAKSRHLTARQARVLTRLHPRDPLTWVELALHQTIRSHHDAALHSMKVALSLAPENRHVLRSAARLFLHQHDPERAHDLIARNDATRHDPWLIAAEIAFAELAERSSKFAKTGLRMLDEQSFRPRHLTELAGSIATQELVNGNRRRSKKTFLQSLLDPTGNALAQGEWVTPHLGADLVPPHRLNSTLEASEALAFHLYRTGEYGLVADVCEAWAVADPFSIRPFEFGASTAGFIEDYDRAVTLALRGLELRPNSPTLLNSAAFALASSHKPHEAQELLGKLRDSSNPRVQYLTLANRGLIAYRLGDHESGRAFYQRAIEGFAKEGLSHMSARAQIYLAREAAFAKSADAADLVARAQKAMKPYLSTDAVDTLRRVEAQVLGAPTSQKKRHPETGSAPSRKITVTAVLPSGETKEFLINA